MLLTVAIVSVPTAIVFETDCVEALESNVQPSSALAAAPTSSTVYSWIGRSGMMTVVPTVTSMLVAVDPVDLPLAL